METKSISPAQFTLLEIVFAAILTFIGMAVLNSVTFADNPFHEKPIYGCLVALIATLIGGVIVLKISTPNSSERLFLMPIVIALTAMALMMISFVIVNGRNLFALLIVFLIVIGVPIAVGISVGAVLFRKKDFVGEAGRKQRRILIGLTALFIAPCITGYLFGQLFRTRCGGCSETAAAAACKAYAEAQEIYHRKDYNGDGVLEYAQSMFGDNSLIERTDGTYDILLIDPAFAKASWDHPAKNPKAGYYFKVLHGEGCGRSYLDENRRQTKGYAVAAFPAVYGKTGTFTYMINKTGTIYQKDLGPNTLAIASAMTDFALDPTWVPAE